MRWTTKLSCDVNLCQEFWCQKLLKSDKYSSTYRQQYEWVFFSETRCSSKCIRQLDTTREVATSPQPFSTELEMVEINNVLPLEAACAVIYFRFCINLLLLLSFERCICILFRPHSKQNFTNLPSRSLT